jgi:hypothetical protein
MGVGRRLRIQTEVAKTAVRRSLTVSKQIHFLRSGFRRSTDEFDGRNACGIQAVKDDVLHGFEDHLDVLWINATSREYRVDLAQLSWPCEVLPQAVFRPPTPDRRGRRCVSRER